MSVSSLPSGCSPTVQPVVAGLDGTDADLREFIDLKVGNILQRLEGQEKLLESISLRFEKVEPENWKAQPWAGRWSGSRRPSATMASASALDVVPMSARNSNPSSTHGGALHFAPRMRQSRDDLRRKGSMASIGEEFASYSRTDARKMNAARDHGQRQMVAAVERRKEPEVRTWKCEKNVCDCSSLPLIERSLEVKLPIMIQYGQMEKQSWEESEKRREEKKKEDQRRERVRRKMQVREKVEKSRNMVFFQCFGAREGRKVGSLKRRVRTHLAR